MTDLTDRLRVKIANPPLKNPEEVLMVGIVLQAMELNNLEAAEEIERLTAQLNEIKWQAVVCQHLTNRSQTIKEAAVPWALIEAIREKT